MCACECFGNISGAQRASPLVGKVLLLSSLLNDAQENLVRVWMLRESREEEATES